MSRHWWRAWVTAKEFCRLGGLPCSGSARQGDSKVAAGAAPIRSPRVSVSKTISQPRPNAASAA